MSLAGKIAPKLTRATNLNFPVLGTLTSSQLRALISDPTGTNKLVFATSPTLITPVLGAASATSISFTSTSGVIGTTTNDNAASGSVGEYLSSDIPQASAVSLTTTLTSNVTSLSLTAGDWEVYGVVSWVFGTGTTDTYLAQGFSSTSAVLPAFNQYSADSGVINNTGVVPTYVVPTQRFSLSTTTSVYLTVNANFSVSTLKAAGFMAARRMR